MRLNQLARHHPLRPLFRQHRIGCDEKPDAARTHVFRAFYALHADVTQEAAQQGLVYLLVRSRQFILAHTHLGNLRVQLLMQLAPLAQAQGGKEIPAAFLSHQPVRLLMGHRLFKPRPYFDVRQKIGTLIRKALMRGIGRLLAIQRAFARVLC